eukprot:GGOE01040453.1.p1 GENE.GGOE01040453.1~~GGOE01040453.1.p1  ORF type:complete len:362 (+),score=114.65 GGOE01040453.1:149-1087(+)
MTKLLVAEVDIQPTRTSLARILLSDDTEIMLRRNLLQQQAPSHQPAFSPAIQTLLYNQLDAYKQTACGLGATQFAAIATAAFRETSNGDALLDRIRSELGIPVEVISQATEGRLGFFTAGVVCPDAPPEQLVVWDSGGGSFQVTSLYKGDAEMYGAAVGSSVATMALVEAVQGHMYTGQSPNPVTLDEAQALYEFLLDQLPEPPIWLRAKVLLQDVVVVGIGGSTSIFNLASQVIGHQEFTAQEVWTHVRFLVNQTDAQLNWYPQREMVLPKLVLMYTVMHKCGIQRVRYCPCNGNTQGMLLFEPFWSPQAS